MATWAGTIVDPYQLVFTMLLDACFQPTEQEDMALHKKESNSDFTGLCHCIICRHEMNTFKTIFVNHPFHRTYNSLPYLGMGDNLYPLQF